MDRLPDLARLKIFLAVATRLNFRRTADDLRIAQPAITRAIKILEEEMGCLLFERTTRQVRLTPSGEALFRAVESAFATLRTGVHTARQTAAGEVGTLSIGYSALTTYDVMPKLIVQYHQFMPSVRTELFLLSTIEQIEALQSGSIDCGLVLSEACRDRNAHFVVKREPLVVLASATSDLASAANLRLSDLSDQSFIFGRRTRWATFRNVMEMICRQGGLVPRIEHEVDDEHIMIRRVSMQSGIALYGESIRASLPADVVAIPISDPHAAFEISVVWNPNNQPPLLLNFLDFMRSYIDANGF
ncbi:MAG TPA: LysR substrate-binding domain-containing protein [Ensifer sp.]|nr:LysR substrate-binding domain-containing protein [Ensifer sp.]